MRYMKYLPPGNYSVDSHNAICQETGEVYNLRDHYISVSEIKSEHYMNVLSQYSGDFFIKGDISPDFFADVKPLDKLEADQ